MRTMHRQPAWDRRGLLIEGARLSIGMAAAAGGALDVAQAASADDEPRTAEVRQIVSPGRILPMFLAVPPRAHGRQAAVLVAHDGPRLGEAGRDLARRIALLGLVGCAPDWPVRGEDQTVLDALGAVQWLGRNPPGRRVLTGRVAAIGIGSGAMLVQALAALAGSALAAVVVAPGAAGGIAGLPTLALDDVTGLSEPASWARVAAFLQEHLR